MKITKRMLGEILVHEGIVRQAYKDSVGVWTWSVGLTNATGHNVERYIDNPQPMAHCLKIFAWALKKYAQDVEEAFAGTSLTEAQFAAALSFHWNTGGIKKASWVKHFKAGNISKARKAFMNWRKPDEIVPRRRKECDLFFEGKWSGDGTVTEYTRVTRNYTPIWATAKRVDVSEELARLFDEPAPSPKKSFWALVAQAIAAILLKLGRRH